MLKEDFEELLDLGLRFCEAPSLVGIYDPLEIVGIKYE